MDTKNPIGIPLHDNCIFGVRKNAAIDIMEEIIKKDALSIGRWGHFIGWNPKDVLFVIVKIFPKHNKRVCCNW